MTIIYIYTIYHVSPISLVVSLSLWLHLCPVTPHGMTSTKTPALSTPAFGRRSPSMGWDHHRENLAEEAMGVTLC